MPDLDIYIPRSGDQRTPVVRHQSGIPAHIRRHHSQETDYASSAESVGEFRFRQSAKGMIQADFHGVAGAKMHRLSGGRFCLVVEPFYKAGGKLARGSKPVTRQDGMRPLISKTPFILWRDLKAAMLREPTCGSDGHRPRGAVKGGPTGRHGERLALDGSADDETLGAGGPQPTSNGEQPFDDPLYEPLGTPKSAVPTHTVC